MSNEVLSGMTARYYTLGCKLNFSETSTFRNGLMNLGVSDAKEGVPADICIINTCSVTGEADHKCRQIIHRMVRENPDSYVVVTGCYAQLEAPEIAAIPGVSLVLGSNEKATLVSRVATEIQAERQKTESESKEKTFGENHLENGKEQDDEVEVSPLRSIRSFQPSCSRGNRTRFFLKVQDGCNYFCTYCTIPFARGLSRNPSIESLVKQAE